MPPKIVNGKLVMKNLLFISVYPFPLDMGSKQHAYFFLKALVAQFNVYCIFFIAPTRQVPSNAKTDILGLGVKDHAFCNFEVSPTRNKYKKMVNDLVTFPNCVHEKRNPCYRFTYS